MSRVPRTLAMAACAGAVFAALIAEPIAAASTRGIRVGSVAPLAAAPGAAGSLPASTRLDLTVALKPRNGAALAAFANAVSTPGSDVYRHYITPGQFARRFGPTKAQIAAVQTSLRTHGLSPGRVSANGLAIPIAATAAQAADAFSISFSKVTESGRRLAFASTAAPLFDAGVAGLVQGVVGLDTLSEPEPLAVRPRGGLVVRRTAPHIVTGGPQPCGAAVAAAPGQGAYTADEIAAAYRFSSLYAGGDEGAGQTIAVYELEPDLASDIAAYQTCYGTNASVTYLEVDGGAGSGPGSGEAALDIEDVIGLAPKANIIVYQGPNENSGAPGAGPYDTYNTIISQDRAKVITTSWGQCEAMEGSADAVAEGTLFQEAATQGQTILSAAGDDGAEDCYAPGMNLDLGAAVDDPASQPYVTGVGGTSLSSVGPPPSETVWNNGGGLSGLLGSSAGASGGGVSAIWKMPVYQSDAASLLHVINSLSSGGPCGVSGYCREVPDVSADADPFTGYLIYYDGAWSGIGGTSAAAPVWAALVALANASPYCAGTSVGFANPALYRAAGQAYGSYFNDVTSGNNDFTGTNSGHFTAGRGYDMTTGLGTPIAPALAVALCETVTVTNPGSQSSMLGRPVSLRTSASDASNAPVTYQATGLPSGLSIDPSTGLITGTPREAGTSTVGLEAIDSGGRVGVASFKWTIKFASVLSTSDPVARCSQLFSRRATHQAGDLRLIGSLSHGAVAVADSRDTLLSVTLAGTTVTIRAGTKVIGTVVNATGRLHALSRSAGLIELASGDRHFRVVVDYPGSKGTAVVSKGLACSYVAARNQTVLAGSGHAVHGVLHLVTSNGADIAGASVRITDGRQTRRIRTSRSGTASFTLPAGPNRTVQAAYAGGSLSGPAKISFRVRNQG